MANQFILTGLIQIKINDVKYIITNTGNGKQLSNAITGKIVAEIQNGIFHVIDETVIVLPIDYTNGILKINIT